MQHKLGKLFFAAYLAAGVSCASIALAGGTFGSWAFPHTGTTHFAQTWKANSRLCGLPLISERLIKGSYKQNFKKCWMSEGPVVIHSYSHPTPRPTATATPLPTTTPFPVSTATQIPTATAMPSTPSAYVVALMNADRAVYGIAPLLEIPSQDGCSLTHSQHMASVGYISHDQFPGDVCIPWSYVGENVGEGGPGDTNSILSLLDQEMMAEPHYVGCTGNHACNIIDARFKNVGVGVYVSGGTVWLTEDFTN